MWTTYLFEIRGNSEYCGEQFLTELKDASRVEHVFHARKYFPDEKLVCLGEVSPLEAEMWGLDTY